MTNPKKSSTNPPTDFEARCTSFEAKPDPAHHDDSCSDIAYDQQYDVAEDEAYPDATQSTEASPSAEFSDHRSDGTALSKKRRLNRYRDCPPDVLDRRRAQNRESQRNFRQRKDQRIRELEDLLAAERSKFSALSDAYATLQSEMQRTEMSNNNHNPYAFFTPMTNAIHYPVPIPMKGPLIMGNDVYPTPDNCGFILDPVTGFVQR